jgi:hypothetical protein
MAPLGKRARRHACSSKSLDSRADRHCDHVLLQSFIVAYACIAPGREHVDVAVFNDHFQADVRELGEKCGNDRGQCEAGRDGGDIQSQSARRPVPKTVHDIKGRLHFS